MKIQRWFGLVAALSVLQLNVKSAYAACESDASGPADTVPADGGSGTHHHESPSTPDASTTSAGSESPSNLPLPADCCQAMTSCGSSAIVNQGTTQLADPIPPAPAIPACGKILHGRITAPEPPPPKA